MGLFNPQVWLNFLALLPANVVAVLTLAIAFLRFYDADEHRRELALALAQLDEYQQTLDVEAIPGSSLFD